jgi:hypothetical protein
VEQGNERPQETEHRDAAIPPLERDRSVTLTNAGSYLPIAFFGDQDLTTNALGMADPGNKTRTAYTHGPC